jgi:hypothetical protein
MSVLGGAMARFGNGWIKLWRSAIEGDLADNPYLWALWNWLLFAAHWKASSIIWKGQRRDIPAGTVVMGISELAEKWECSQSTIKKWLIYLVTSERILLETSSRGSLVTIRNWDIYQAPYAEHREPSVSEVGAKCEPSENEVRLIEEGKKEERRKEDGDSSFFEPVKKEESSVFFGSKKKKTPGIRFQYSAEFEKLWESYGRIGDKKAAFEVFQRLNLSASELDHLPIAVEKYSANYKSDRTYQKHFATFLNSDWRVYLAESPREKKFLYPGQKKEAI